MGHTFGVFTNSQKSVTFGKMTAQIVEGVDNPNHPDNPESPNAPRGDHYPGYQNPQLGDEGVGKIGRWSSVSIDALEVVIEQMIEQYLRDKTWYGKVRCREALWNMYRRIEWWVKQQIDPTKNDYQRALQMIRDCINHILTEAQDNVSLPLCPVPYDMPFHGDYFNHYDGKDVEVKLFDSRDLPRSDDFPGLFRYVSSTEDQEWELVHSTGADELQGSETILKLSMSRLLFGNSSKVNFNWRFKKRGFIRFKYLASTAAGNGLTFFINNNQVGGEWNHSTGWQEVKFNVQPGQTYKFDWLARKQNEIPWGSEAIYIKDIECIEVIKSLEAPTPPDFDTLGPEAYANPNFEWITYSNSSVVRTRFDGVVTEDNRARKFAFDMNNECDGVLSFAYRMNVSTPVLTREYYLMFNDDLLNRTQQGNGPHGSSVQKNHDGNWDGNGQRFETQKDAAKITYELTVGEDCTVDANGTLQIVCPVYEIDHYEPSVIQTISDAPWYPSGQWQFSGTGGFVLNDPQGGISDLSTNVNLLDDGWFTFDYNHDLRESESLQVLVDGELSYYSGGARSGSATIPLQAGSHSIIFRLQDDFIEEEVRASVKKTYTYGTGGMGVPYTTNAPLGSSATVTRNFVNKGDVAETFENGKTIQYDVKLNTGATFTLNEMVEFVSDPANTSDYVKKFDVNFNTENEPEVVLFSGAWEWARQIPSQPDGLFKVDGVAGDHTAVLSVSNNYPGYVTFQYGGKYGAYDYMSLKIGNTTIWTGNVSSGSVDTDVKVAIPAGTYQLKWVYHCAEGGSTETTPPDTNYPPSSGGGDEICYPQQHGVQTPIQYSQVTGSATNARGTKIGWGGKNIIGSQSAHSITTDGGTVVRDFTPSAIDTMYFSETLRVQAGTKTPVRNVYDMGAGILSGNRGTNVKQRWIPMEPPFNTEAGHWAFDYYSINLVGDKSINTDDPGFETVYPINLEGQGEIRISLNYITHLENKFPVRGGSNTTGSRARYRAEFRIYITNMDTGAVVYMHKQTQSVGYRQDVNDITNWHQDYDFNLTKKLPTGKYKVHLRLKDLTDDYDKDDQGYYFYAAFRNFSVKYEHTMVLGGYDDTEVKVEFVDKTTGTVLDSQTYSGANNLGREYNINFNAYTPGHWYQVRYTLIKGTGTDGGLTGNGGSFTAYNGAFVESWPEYCVSNGRYYPANQSYTPTPPPDTVITVPATPDAWAWLDAISVYGRNNPICADTRLVYQVYDGSTLIDSQTYNNHTAVETMTKSITNNTDVVKTYRIVETFYSSCNAGVRLSKGEFTIDDCLRPKPSWATITGYSATNNKAIWMGGCDASSITVRLLDEQGFTISTQQFSYGGLHSFGVSDLLNQPYSKYRIEIETDQLGVVSSYTGKKYMTTFRLLDFKVTEEWQNVPDPFNGKLEFFIDSQLMGTYTDSGGGFSTVSFPVTKGTHAYKWVFTELGNGNSYDQCEIDFFQLTNWICDKVRVVPYCEPGGGDKCVEELIKCLLKMWNDRPKACVIGKRVWLFT